jgi:hypothetical protein
MQLRSGRAGGAVGMGLAACHATPLSANTTQCHATRKHACVQTHIRAWGRQGGGHGAAAGAKATVAFPLPAVVQLLNGRWALIPRGTAAALRACPSPSPGPGPSSQTAPRPAKAGFTGGGRARCTAAGRPPVRDAGQGDPRRCGWPTDGHCSCSRAVRVRFPTASSTGPLCARTTTSHACAQANRRRGCRGCRAVASGRIGQP